MDFMVYYVGIHVKNVVLCCFDMCISEQELQVLGAYFNPYWVSDIASKNHCIKYFVLFCFLIFIFDSKPTHP